jgi:hypothetical protein
LAAQRLAIRMTSSPLAGWDNFYVIAGSSAAGLTGLTFVVITLAADAHRVSVSGLRTFVTPTIVHFGAVLALAAFLSMPGQNVLSLSLGFGVMGVAGLSYVAVIIAGIRRLAADYVPVRDDWIWNAILPAMVYGTLVATAGLVWWRPQQSLYGAAAAVVVLMIIGIHNAWDIAIWNSIRKQQDPP